MPYRRCSPVLKQAAQGLQALGVDAANCAGLRYRFWQTVEQISPCWPARLNCLRWVIRCWQAGPQIVLGAVTGLDVHHRLLPSVAAALLAVGRGARVIRTPMCVKRPRYCGRVAGHCSWYPAGDSGEQNKLSTRRQRHGPKNFGTDGIRGTVGQAPITPDFVLRLAHAVGRVLRQTDDRPTVLIGKDTRISGYMLEIARWSRALTRPGWMCCCWGLCPHRAWRI